jgi:hypothetical protein
MKKYEGKIIEQNGWTQRYILTKDDGTVTAVGSYEDIFHIGPNRYVMSPYYHGKDYWCIFSAEAVMKQLAVS